MDHSTQGIRSSNPVSHLVHVVIGALIGLAEMVPGVSGGTIALISGIYERAINNADALLNVAKSLVRDRSNLAAAVRKVEWLFLAAVAVGMLGTVFALSGVVHSFVENSPQTAHALFLGMVAVSLVVPIKQTNKQDLKAKLIPALSLLVATAIGMFFLTGFTSAEKSDPSLLIIFGAAAIAICALVLPGVSGSFILLAIGLYEPVIGAVSERNLTVLLVFVAGALTGLSLFIKVLNYLLNNHHSLTMMAMAGLMLGSLRALWPWTGDSGELLAPSGNTGWLLSMMALGGAIAGAVMILERFNTQGSKN
ncbi:DUF368 domain-containing protein [Corynebacterium sp. ES2794-CONJ1]|uniref:DUF368 domain-containing protein n=1 Tax=unclassified Corynebacterium TaxID=2624378 RepID=UPI002168B918|nr:MULTISPECIES: DUF368 domain-containing protein [unclassified Corynebacterium]MCS4490734.1 DUF368 domain-containing protein [Corynebacterium sp. ES2775-CONJ]MCS4492536.1 DUF368 domain-containing protein [Corynebacterium sp. ES2715-CONJ3]MCS4532637.1 DUF368 domain-containing protein [Corynebacterium sp. ES2730-CONJ]MCU9520032.1 DUF368 domain-containing protein [Corynebacterium sp. ES2794-CONJ1]